MKKINIFIIVVIILMSISCKNNEQKQAQYRKVSFVKGKIIGGISSHRVFSDSLVFQVICIDTNNDRHSDIPLNVSFPQKELVEGTVLIAVQGDTALGFYKLN